MFSGATSYSVDFTREKWPSPKSTPRWKMGPRRRVEHLRICPMTDPPPYVRIRHVIISSTAVPVPVPVITVTTVIRARSVRCSKIQPVLCHTGCIFSFPKYRLYRNIQPFFSIQPTERLFWHPFEILYQCSSQSTSTAHFLGLLKSRWNLPMQKFYDAIHDNHFVIDVAISIAM